MRKAIEERISRRIFTDEYMQDLVDLGIAKLHFEQGADNGGKFEFGNGGCYILKGNPK